jgi:hypothetical protein
MAHFSHFLLDLSGYGFNLILKHPEQAFNGSMKRLWHDLETVFLHGGHLHKLMSTTVSFDRFLSV